MFKIPDKSPKADLNSQLSRNSTFAIKVENKTTDICY